MNLLRRIRTLFRRRAVEAEMAEEMRFHVEQRAADFADDGLAAVEARLAAQRKFGNVASIQEHARDARGWRELENFFKDLRFAARQLVRAPAFSLVALVTLGFGIGANTAMFSLLNSLILRPLPYPELAQLDQIYRTTAQQPQGNAAPADFLDLRRTAPSYGEFAAYRFASVSASEAGQPAHVAFGVRASFNLFTVLGVQPQLGRNFRAGEEVPGQHRVVILSQRWWRMRFAQRPDIIGQTMRLDGEPHEIIGVLPESFNEWRHLGSVDVFVPLALTPTQAADRQSTTLRIIGRRTAERTPADGASLIANFGTQLAREFPLLNAGVTWRSVPLQSIVADADFRLMLPMLVGLSGCVLLIACSNLANLMLVRTTARAREFAVRAALGASRVQLLRPLITESLLLSLLGGALAVLVALGVHDWIAARTSNENGEHIAFVLDWKVLGWAFLASLATTVAFGLAPVLFALRLDLNATLKSGGRGATDGRGHRRFRQFLIVGQFAFAMVLLAGAAFFVRGLDNLQRRPAGWNAAPVLTGSLVLPAQLYADADKITAFHRALLDRLTALPGVTAASLSTATPFFHWSDVRKFHVDGRERAPAGREPAAMINRVTPNYFSAFDTRVIAGRVFDERDHAAAGRVYLLDQSTAQAFFGDENPVGRRLELMVGAEPRTGEIVGVVADVQAIETGASAVPHRIYLPLAQEPPAQFTLAVRASGVSPATLIDAVRGTVTGLDADLPVRRLQPAETTLDRALGDIRVFRDLLGAFGLLGLGLASLGVYGLISRTVAQRAGEFAIRLALGAQATDVTRLVLGAGLRQALVGSALGLLGAIGVTAVIASAFPGIRANSVPILVGATVVLTLVSLLACWLPARRAGEIDAMHALRAD